MLGTYYYHEIIRKTIIAFGTLFNTIDIKHKKPDGTVHTSVRVPIAYGPVEKFLARLEQKPDLRQRVAITCLLYTSPSPRDLSTSRMPSSA